VCTVDLPARRLRVATAGHPPPLLATHAHARALDDVTDVPLGAGMRPRRQTEHALPSDSALLLYTDGLVERRDESLQHGLERLKRSTAHAAPDPEAIVDAVLDAARLTQTAGDDVAILAVAFA
jgi:serine phosphatase RsbU (regulator of sigma subunit)